jgi:CubicO group peptidase (beta-lactamase class C family)
MQRVNRREFLNTAAYGALSVPIKGNLSLVPLAKFPTLPPASQPSKAFDAVEKQANAFLQGYNLPGVAIGLIRDNKLVYAKGFGVQSVVTRRPMSEYTIFSVASMSKMLTGAAILQLQEAERLNLDDTYVQHVPYFRMADPRYQQITLRHLLAHTSGLPEVSEAIFFSEWDHPWNDDGCAERLVRSLDGGLMLTQDPGAANAVFRYSDVGYDLLAALIYEKTGKLFEQYMREHILDPLQMFNSTFLKGEVRSWRLAAPHIRDAGGNPMVWKRYPYARQLGPSGCFLTNIVDMSHWVMANINGGVFIKRIMLPETQASLWQPLYHDFWGWTGTGYNSGFLIMSYAESGIGPVRMIASGGGEPGINVHITIFPDQGIAAIVFVNLLAAWKDPLYSWGICDNLAIQMLRGDL